MKIISGDKYFTAKEVGLLVNRTHLTVHLWDTWSNELHARGDKRLIPEPIKIGKQQTRYWSERDVSKISEFARNIKRGDLAEFSQRQWAKKKSNGHEKMAGVSHRKLLKFVAEKSELGLDERMIYTLLFLLNQQSSNGGVRIEEIVRYFQFGREPIQSSVEKLVTSKLIGCIGDRYVLI